MRANAILIPVIRIHVRLYLENQRRQPRPRSASTVRVSATCARGGGPNRNQRCPADPARQFPCIALPKIHRRQATPALKLSARSHSGNAAAHQIQLIPQRLDHPGVRLLVNSWLTRQMQVRVCSTSYVPTKSSPPAPPATSTGDVSSASVLPTSSSELERIARLAIHLVDERDDRNIPQPANLEQLARARLDPLRRIDHHHRAESTAVSVR